jgi:hypothetical protein
MQIDRLYFFLFAFDPAVPSIIGNRTFFPMIPALRFAKIESLCSMNRAQFIGDTSIATSLNPFTITLIDTQQNVFVDNVPLNYFANLNFEQDPKEFTGGGRVIDWQKCYIDRFALGVGDIPLIFTYRP